MADLPKYGSGIRGFFKYDHAQGKLVAVDKPKAAVVAAPYVHQDTIAPLESMVNERREIFESKSAYRRHLKANGFRESYGQTFTPEKPDLEKQRRELRDTIEKSYHDLKNDRIPLTEKEKELCKQENRKYQDWVKRNGH